MKKILPCSVSVVMATYNGEKYLLAQLKSVLNELLPGDELVVIDDGSSDATLDILQSIDSPLIRILPNSINTGVLATFERGLSLARHDIVFLCDQDDIWIEGKRTAFMAIFEAKPQVLLVLSDAQIINSDGAVIVDSFMETRKGFHGGFISTIIRNRYLGCAMAFRRELLVAALPISRSVPMHDMWLGALATVLGKIHYIQTPLIQYRRHASNASPSVKQPWQQMFSWRFALASALTIRLLSIAWLRHRSMISQKYSGVDDA